MHLKCLLLKKDIGKFGMHSSIDIPIYLPGKKVTLTDNRTGIIDHVHVSGYNLAVKLREITELIPVQYVILEPTKVNLTRLKS